MTQHVTIPSGLAWVSITTWLGMHEDYNYYYNLYLCSIKFSSECVCLHNLFNLNDLSQQKNPGISKPFLPELVHIINSWFLVSIINSFHFASFIIEVMHNCTWKISISYIKLVVLDDNDISRRLWNFVNQIQQIIFG